MRSTRRFTTTLIALGAFAASARAQTTWYVDASAIPPGNGSPGSPYANLQFCFAQGSTLDGDTVLVAPGTYVEDLDLLGKSLDVRSTGAPFTAILRPATATSAVTVNGVANARFEGFTVRDGSGTSDGTHTRGGGVFCSASTLELSGCYLFSNQASLGGNLCVQGHSFVTMNDCIVEAGKAWEGGGVHVEGSRLVAQNTVFTANNGPPSAPSTGLPRRGLGLHSSAGAELELYGCEISSNKPVPSAQFEGAGMYHEGSGTAFLDDCTLSFNGQISVSNSWGGAVYAAGAVEITSSTISDNRALHEGGGVRGANAALVHLVDCDVTRNWANNGGGVYRATLEDCRLVDNLNANGESPCTGSGGGAHSSTLTGCLLQGNSSGGLGGGAYSSTLIECELVGNRVDAGSICAGPLGGGGIWGGSATDCSFRENAVRRLSTTGVTGVQGGGAGQATLTRCALEGNWVESANSSFPCRGGGAYACSLADGTLTGNHCKSPVGNSSPQGGGCYGGSASGCVFVDNRVEALSGSPLAAGGGAAEASLTLCVLTGNVADHGGGAWRCGLSRCSVGGNLANGMGGGLSLHPGPGTTWATASADETILWGNTPDSLEVGSGSFTAVYCDVASGWPGTGNIDADPKFWNVGVGDLHLRPGSPCIGAGNPSLPADPDGSAREIGAYVYDPNYVGGPYVYCEAKTTAQGCVPSVGFTGTPTVSGPDDFFVEATQVTANQNGILFWGHAPAAVPFLGGTRCVASPVVRTAPVSSGGSATPCTGTYHFHFAQSYALGHGLAAGDRVFAQFWFRDPTQPDGTAVGLSDALDFTLLP